MEDEGRMYDVYNLAGFKIMSNAKLEDLKTLPNGIYIYGGKKILISK